MKIYGIFWGYSSCDNSSDELDSLWTNEDIALKYLKNKATDQRNIHKETIPNYYTDGDHFIYLKTLNADTEWLNGEQDDN
jgi:hypothetical protein